MTRFAVLILLFLSPALAFGQERDAADGRKEKIKPISKSGTVSNTKIHPNLVARALKILPGNQPLTDELGVLDYQIEQFKELQYALQKKINETAKTTTGKSPVDRRAEFEKLYEETYGELKTVLLPRQVERLMQVSMQSFAVNPTNGKMDLARLIANPAVRLSIKLPQKKVLEIRAKIRQEELRIEEEVKRMREQSRENVLGLLSPEERTEIERLIGPEFDFKGITQSRGGRFRKSDKDDH